MDIKNSVSFWSDLYLWPNSSNLTCARFGKRWPTYDLWLHINQHLIKKTLYMVIIRCIIGELFNFEWYILSGCVEICRPSGKLVFRRRKHEISLNVRSHLIRIYIYFRLRSVYALVLLFFPLVIYNAYYISRTDFILRIAYLHGESELSKRDAFHSNNRTYFRFIYVKTIWYRWRVIGRFSITNTRIKVWLMPFILWHLSILTTFVQPPVL